MSEHETPRFTNRIAIGTAIALVAAVIASVKLRHRWTIGATGAADFTWWWRTGHALLFRQSPYLTIDATGPYPFPEALLYPLLAAVASVPFALLDTPRGFVALCTVSAGVLAFSLTRDGYWRLPALMSMPMLTRTSNRQGGSCSTRGETRRTAGTIDSAARPTSRVRMGAANSGS